MLLNNPRIHKPNSQTQECCHHQSKGYTVHLLMQKEIYRELPKNSHNSPPLIPSIIMIALGRSIPLVHMPIPKRHLMLLLLLLLL